MKNLRASLVNLSSQRGMTLVEIVVVLIILGLVVTFFGGKVLGAGDAAKADLTRIRLSDVRMAIDNFRLRYNSIPNSLAELTGCSERTGNSCVPIIRDISGIQDSWGNNLEYRVEGNGRQFTITSLGADSRPGGSGVDGDITLTGP